MINQEKALKYIKKNESACLECGSSNIIGEQFEVANDYVIQEINCEHCGTIYYDIYKLIGVGIIEPDAIVEYYADGKIEHG